MCVSVVVTPQRFSLRCRFRFLKHSAQQRYSEWWFASAVAPRLEFRGLPQNDILPLVWVFCLLFVWFFLAQCAHPSKTTSTGPGSQGSGGSQGSPNPTHSPTPLPTHTQTHICTFTFCSNISRITCLLPAREPPQRPQWSGMCCRVNAAPETEREICPPVSQELWGSRPSEFIEWASGCDNSAAAVSAQVLCVLTFGWLRIDQLAAISEHWSLRGARGSSLLSSSLLLATLTRRFFFFVCFFKKIPAQILKCFKKQSHSCLSTYAGYQVHSKIEVI